MRAPLRCLPILCGALLAAQPAGAEIVDLQVQRTARQFDVRFEVLLDAPPERLLELFDEPQRWVGLSQVIRSAARLDGPGRPVSMVFYDCILFLCMEATKVSVFRVDRANGIVTGRSVPRRGDFRRLDERWRIVEREGRTQLSFRGNIEPAFAVPPFVGPLVLRSTLRRLLQEMEANLERAADQ